LNNGGIGANLLFWALLNTFGSSTVCNFSRGQNNFIENQLLTLYRPT
jgi:hypothetical protein